jgi:hypothetical protein
MVYVSTQGKTVLSAMLHPHDGHYEDGAVTYWNKLKGVFGEEQKLKH